MSSASKEVVRRFVEEYQSGDHDVAVARQCLADDFVDHSPFGPFAPDRDGVLALFDHLFGAFDGFQAVIHRQVSEGELVTTHKTFHGRHTGEFMGIPPTSAEISFDVIDILRVSDRKMREHWNVVDALGLMQQLSAVPLPAA
jgi:predicted ester cyclase